MMRNRILVVALALLAGAVGFARPVAAQLDQFDTIRPATEYVAWAASVRPDSVQPGGSFALVLDARIAAPWKLYALDETLPPLSEGPRPYGVIVDWEPFPSGIGADGPGAQAAPEVGLDPNFEKMLGWFHDQARFTWPMRAAVDAASGAWVVRGTVRFQICNDDRGVCLPPTPVVFSASIVVDPDCRTATADTTEECEPEEIDYAALLADPVATDTPGARPEGPVDASAGSGLFGFLLLALGAGLASLLTPCVFPMVPLTVSYFTRHTQDRGQAVRMASAFGASIVFTFTALGVLMAVLVGAAGAQSIAANPWVNLFIALVLIVFALSLLGLFELRLPSSLLNYSNRQSSERTGYVGVLFMGLTLTLVSFSCTAPFVGGLLAAAAGGTWAYPLAGMLVYSAAFALPFVLLAIFPGALARLPKSGSWMNVMKVVLGFIELAAALKFLSNADLVWGWDLVSRPIAIALTIVIFGIAGLYLLGKVRFAHEEETREIGVGRLVFAMLFIATALYMMPGLFGAPLNSLDAFLPPRQGTDVSLLGAIAGSEGRSETDENWFVDDIDAALAAASSQGRPLFVDFTGYTCTNCREMEANVFPRPAVAERFSRDFVLLRLYTDGLELGPDFQRYQLDLTGTVALPTYAVLHPDGRTLLGRAVGLMDEEDFVRFLDRAVAAGQTS